MGKNILIVVENSRNPLYIGTYPFLGPLYVASFLEAKGIRADFLDKWVDDGKKIDYARYDIVGFSANVNNIENSLASARSIKSIRPDADIVFGGPYASAYPQRLLDNDFIDAVVVGEGEETFFEFAAGAEKSRIQGLWHKEGGRAVFNGPRGWIRDLDLLPFPALGKLDMKKYALLYSKSIPASAIVTSRGCSYRCTFCFHNLGYEWRARSPKNVVDEIEWQVRTLGVREILIQDDNFSFDVPRAKEICDEIVRRGIQVALQLSNGIRVDRVDRELIEKMRDAGVWSLCVAPETGSRDSFRKLNKGFVLEDAEKAVRWAKEAGIVTEAFFVIGFPWETDEDMKQTVDYSVRLGTDFSYLHQYIRFPKTELHASADTVLDDPAVFDRSYATPISDSREGIAKAFALLYRRQYFSPRRMIRIFLLLRLYSLPKILSPFLLKAILKNALAKFAIMFPKKKARNGQ